MSARIHLIAAALAAGSLTAIACSTQPRRDDAPPADLSAAIGAVDHDGALPLEEQEGELLTWDLEPFFQAGLPTPDATVSELVMAVVGRDSWSDPWSIRVRGRHLVIRHEPAVVAQVRRFLAALEHDELRPIRLDVHTVEIPAVRLAGIPAADDGRPATLLDEAFVAAIRTDLGAGAAKSVARRQLRLVNGQWGRSADRRSRRPIVRIRVEGGRPVEDQETAEDGLALQAAVWVSSTDEAVLHLEAALQVEDASVRRTASAAYHPDPTDQAVEVEARLDLPRIRTSALRGQAVLTRGRWQLVASAPAVADDRLVVALVRADWSEQPRRLARFDLGDGRVLSAIPVALPESAPAQTVQLAGGFVWGKETTTGLPMLAGVPLTAANNAFREEVSRQAHVRTNIQNELNVQSGDDLVPFQSMSFQKTRYAPASRPGPAWQPLLPEAIERLRRAIAREPWDPKTMALFRWDDLFVVHRADVVDRTDELIRAVLEWKNRPVTVRAEWVELSPVLADAIRGPDDVAARLDEIRSGRLLPPLLLNARSGHWSEMAISVNDAILWGFLGSDRPSPEVRMLPHGSSLSVLPRRYGNGRLEVSVDFVRNQIDAGSLAPIDLAEGTVQKPRFAQARVDHAIAVEPGRPMLLLESSDGRPDGRVRALLVTAWD